METKVCSKCKENKKLSDFSRSYKTKTSLMAHCKTCAYEYKKKWLKSEKGRTCTKKNNSSEAAKKAQQKYRQSDKYKARYKELYSKKTRERNAKWREANPGKNAKTCRKWRQKNKEHFKQLIENKRLKLKLAALGKYYSYMQKLEKTIRAQGLSMDHIVPINGKEICGLNVPWNVQVISEQENRSKNNWFDPQVYEIWRKNGENGPFLKPKF